MERCAVAEAEVAGQEPPPFGSERRLVEPGRKRRGARAGAGAFDRSSEATPCRRRQPREQVPGRRFAHEEVGIVRGGLAGGRDGHADRKPGRDQGREQGTLIRRQRQDAVVAGDHREARGHRIVLPQHRVGGRHGHVRDRGRKHGIADVDEPGDRAGGRIHQHVPVVGVVVDDGVPQPHEGRGDASFEAIEVRGHQPAPLDATDGLEPGARGQRLTDVPVEPAESTGVAKTPERHVEPAEEPPEVSERRRRAGDARHRHPGQPADQPERVALTRRPGRVREIRPVDGRDHPRQRQFRGAGLDVAKQRRLEGHRALGFGGVHDLERELAAGRSHERVLVALAVERRDHAVDPEMGVEQAAHGLREEVRARVIDEAHGMAT